MVLVQNNSGEKVKKKKDFFCMFFFVFVFDVFVSLFRLMFFLQWELFLSLELDLVLKSFWYSPTDHSCMLESTKTLLEKIAAYVADNLFPREIIPFLSERSVVA